MVLEAKKIIRLYERYFGYLILFILIFFNILWHLNNNQLPLSDDGDHFRISLEIYQKLSLNFFDGVKFALYSPGKPILFSIFAIPFMPLFSINYLLPLIIFTITIFTLTTFAYYRLFRINNTRNVSALFTATLLSSPFIFSIHTMFMSEIVWHLWFVIFLLFIHYSKNFSHNYFSILAGFFLALAFLARPIESILIISPLLCIYFFYLNQIALKNIIFFLKPTIFLILSIFIFSLFSWFGINKTLSIIFLFFITFLVIYFYSSKYQFIERSIINFYTTFNFFICFWFIFYFRPLAYWSYDSSFGNGALVNDQSNSDKGFFKILYELTNDYGFIFIFILSFYVCVLFIQILIKNQKKQLIDLSHFYAFLACIFSILPMVGIYVLTGTSDSRRIFLGFVIFCFLGLYILGNLNFKLKFLNILKFFLISTILIIHLFSILIVIYKNDFLLNTGNNIEKIYGSLKYRQPSKIPYADDAVIRELKDVGVNNSKVCVLSLGLLNEHANNLSLKKNSFTDYVFVADYSSESIRYVDMINSDKNEYMHLFGFVKNEEYENSINRLRTMNFEYLLLDSRPENILDDKLKKRYLSHTHFVNNLLEKITEFGPNKLPGLEFVHDFIINGRPHYLFRIQYPPKPTVKASSQLDDLSASGLLDSVQPGWHAELNPTYPQEIEIKFTELQKNITVFKFLFQDHYPKRGPKNIDILASVDGEKWNLIHTDNDLCSKKTLTTSLTDGETISSVMKNKVSFKQLRIKINSNCGDEEYLTLRGFQVQ